MKDQELSYIDLLQKLKADVKSDTIPEGDKADILRSISRLEILLWPYSY